MFTFEQIDDLHTRLGSARTLLAYVRALHELGIERYTSYLSDGHTEYVGGGHSVVSPPVHDRLTIAKTSDRESFLEHLRLHEQGKTSYLEMSRGLAESGIEQWSVDTREATMTFLDLKGQALLVQNIE